MSVNQPEAPTVLFIDSHCVLCDGFARWVLRRTRASSPLKISELSALQEMGGQSDSGLGERDAIVLKTRNQTLYGAEALIALAAELDWFGALSGRALQMLPTVLRERVYDRVAAMRSRVFGRQQYCSLELAGNPRFLAKQARS